MLYLTSCDAAHLGDFGGRSGAKSMDIRSRLTAYEPATYRIYVQGHLAERWSEYLGGMTIEVRESEDQYPVTVLTGRVNDQAGLLGVLLYLYNRLHLPLLAVECLSCQDIPDD